MLRKTMLSLVSAALFLGAAVLPSLAQDLPTITFDNSSGQSALVKLIGPTDTEISVPDGSSRVVQVSGGNYYILCRYGSEGHYRYTKGAPFLVVQTSTQVSRVRITLHKVIGGNYNTRDTSEAEFSRH